MIQVYIVMRGGTHRKQPSQVFFDQEDAIAASADDGFVVQCELVLPVCQRCGGRHLSNQGRKAVGVGWPVCYT